MKSEDLHGVHGSTGLRRHGHRRWPSGGCKALLLWVLSTVGSTSVEQFLVRLKPDPQEKESSHRVEDEEISTGKTGLKARHAAFKQKKLRHPGAGRGPSWSWEWIPAFAGMTGLSNGKPSSPRRRPGSIPRFGNGFEPSS